MERFAISYLKIREGEFPALMSTRKQNFNGGACSNYLILSFALTDLNRRIRFYNNGEGKGEFRERALRAAGRKEGVLGWALGQAGVNPSISSKAAEVLEAMVKYGSPKYQDVGREVLRSHGDCLKQSLENDSIYGVYLDKEFIEEVLA